MQLTDWPTICCKGRVLRRQLSQWYQCSCQAEQADQACTNSIILALFLIPPAYREGLLQAGQKGPPLQCPVTYHQLLAIAAPWGTSSSPLSSTDVNSNVFQFLVCIPQAPSRLSFIMLLTCLTVLLFYS